MIRVLDLFSAAAGGWSLGMHRAGYRTIAACEVIHWRRALYSENNPGVPVYDDVTTLTADRLVRDGIGLPDIVVGSPPCQDISGANTKGKGVDGERSGLYFEAVRLIDECRPRWFALENSANLRTRGADRVIDALEGIGYTCWPFVVSAGKHRSQPRTQAKLAYWIQMFHTPTTKANFAADSMQKWESCRPWNVMLATPRKAMMPTPRASDANHGPEITKATSEKTTGVSLVTTMAMGTRQLETLPTPTKRDKRMDSWSPAYDKRHSPTMDAVMDGAMTGRASEKWAGARALAHLLQSHGLTGTAALPITYGWMMGYPSGWLSRALQSAVHAGQLQLASSSRRSATQSARRSQKPSVEPS